MASHQEAPSRRRPAVVVIGLATLAVLVVLLGLTQTVLAVAFAWGFVWAGVVVGGTCLVTLAVALVVRGRRRG